MQGKQNFEEDWREAFDGAEMPARDQLWANIELDLAEEESRKMKKRVVFYQRIAAGLLIVSASLGGYVWNLNNEPTTVAVVQKKADKENKEGNETTPAIEPASNGQRLANENSHGLRSGGDLSSAPQQSGTPRSRGNNDRSAELLTTSTSDNANTITPFQETDSPFSIDTTALAGSRLGLNENQAVLLADNEIKEEERLQPDSVTAMTEEEALKIVDAFLQEQGEKNEKKPTKEALWLAMGAAAGSYNPNASFGSSSSSADFANAYADKNSFNSSQVSAPPATSRQSVGSAYSVGLSVGTKVSERWVVQSGVNYVNQRIDYVSNLQAYNSRNEAQLFVPEYLAGADSRSSLAAATTTSLYTINSAVELVSIPLQAGYLIVDRRIAWQVNSGVSTDIFVRNTLVDESGRTEKFSESAGEESPYRTVTWSGLLNTELSYRVGESYRLAIVPGFRYAFATVLKDGSSMPLVVDIGFRFRYFFP